MKRNKKHTLSIAFLALFLGSSQSGIAQSKLPCPPYEILKAWNAKWYGENARPTHFLLYDIDKDGVNEILVKGEKSPNDGQSIFLWNGKESTLVTDLLNHNMDVYISDDGTISHRVRSYGYDNFHTEDFLKLKSSAVAIEGTQDTEIIQSEEFPDAKTSFSIKQGGKIRSVSQDEFEKTFDTRNGKHLLTFENWQPFPYVGIYKGKIGPYPITMYLMRESNPSGCYCYDSNPNSFFRLECVSDESNPKGFEKVTLKEYTAAGKNTGTFVGNLENRGDGFKGTFTNSKGKTFQFELMDTLDKEE